jgi:cyclic-di-GMP phosphodiesterase TipF (flagellum assembly factor)
MVRLGAIFIAICIVLIAASLGAGSYLYFGFSGAESSILALSALTALALYNTVSTRLRDRHDVGTQIADLSRGSADLARQVAELGRRVASVESKIEGSLNKSRTFADPLAAELGELGTLVKQLAEAVAGHETMIRNQAAPHPAQAAAPVPQPAVAAARPSPAAAIHEAPSEPAADHAGMAATVRDAIADGRIDLYLQPVVTLPQRKVRYYEALSRMRLESGEVISACDFLEPAEAGGLMAEIDTLALFRSVQVVRRLLMKNREIGLFCNIAGSTLSDAQSFPQLTEFADANRALAGALVFEFTQRTVRGLGPIEQEGLAALAERGFRFSVDQVTDLRFEPRELADRGFRFVKVPASLLLSKFSNAGTDIHPADLSDLLGRYGIELIADHVENETSVVDLLDFDVHYGQGLLFSPPRPVRQEALRGNSDRAEGVASARMTGEERAAGRMAASAGGRPASLVERI